MHDHGQFSLLFPDSENDRSFGLETDVIKDLELDTLVDFMMPETLLQKKPYEFIRNILHHPSSSSDTIKYRQDIIRDLLELPEVFQVFEKLYPLIEELTNYRAARFANDSPVYQLVYRINELEYYITCIDLLKEAFEKSGVTAQNKARISAGLGNLYDLICAMYDNENFMHLRKELPELSGKIRNFRSLSIGINLDDSLHPESVTLISLNTEVFDNKSPGLMNKLFNRNTDDLNSATPLHRKESSILSPLFADLDLVLKKICAQIQAALNRYIKINTHLFTQIHKDILFYISSIRLLLLLKENQMPVCKPDIAPAEERVIRIENNYNINLFIHKYGTGNQDNLHEEIITNNVHLDDEGRILILTGPNQGGKTVFTQAVGLSQVMFQAGLFIPGTRAVMSPVDTIFTHFQTDEQTSRQLGRFADEAKRFQSCIHKITDRSLVLMNESFASTNYAESLFIVKEIMQVFRIIGSQVVFATHFHDLAMQVNEINNSTKGKSKLISMVSRVIDNEGAGEKIKRTFKILPGPPAGKSYARDIALNYGIGFDQLLDIVEERGLA
ncbi:MAG: hypothetical protein JW969_00590 [Spirochaetales bacterium]|nr:hypothetical protein [Spirochaetales bacterium]